MSTSQLPPRHPRRGGLATGLVGGLALLSSLPSCSGDSGGAARTATSETTGPGATTQRSVVERSLPPSVCLAPTTSSPRSTTTAVPPLGGWPPPGVDRSALVRIDLLSWHDGVAHVRWQAGQGVDACETDLRTDTAWVLDASGYKPIHGQEIADFVAQRLTDLGSTADGVPFLVEVSDGGQTARQLGEIPPG